MYDYVEVYVTVDLSHGLVSRVGPGIDVLGRMNVSQTEGVLFNISSRVLNLKAESSRLHHRLRLKSIRVFETNVSLHLNDWCHSVHKYALF